MNEQQLLQKYKDQVAKIPEIRLCLSYPEEIAVLCLEHLINECNRHMAKSELMYKCMKISKGHANPGFVDGLIDEWLATIPEHLSIEQFLKFERESKNYTVSLPMLVSQINKFFGVHIEPSDLILNHEKRDFDNGINF